MIRINKFRLRRRDPASLNFVVRGQHATHHLPTYI